MHYVRESDLAVHVGVNGKMVTYETLKYLLMNNARLGKLSSGVTFVK